MNPKILNNFAKSDKADVFNALLRKLEENYDAIIRSAEAAHDGATHEDAVAKSKYDTHGLELSYLAGSQYERAEKLKVELNAIRAMPKKCFSEEDPVSHGALIELRNLNSNSARLVFLLKYGAGVVFDWNGHSVQVISLQTPMGEAVMDCYVGDEIVVGANANQIFEITALA